MCGQDCWSALISAAKEGHVDVVKELLENSAYIEHRDVVRFPSASSAHPGGGGRRPLRQRDVI